MIRVAAVLAAILLVPAIADAGDLDDALGRNEVRVWSAPYRLLPGRTVFDIALDERLERLGYRRVRGKRPEAPGEYFWGNEVFWIYRRAHRAGGKEWPAALIGLELGSGGRITGYRSVEDPETVAWLEPELLSESLAGDRAPRRLIALDDLPEHVWRAVLAAEDARFFKHGGVDAKSLARALLANVKAGKVKQGGSTITQQLIKNRDLTPRRSVNRKASEAVRALALEAAYDKRDILEAYLNQVYLGHVGGLAIHGYGAAARAYFGISAKRLDLAQAALLAAMIQGPNRLSPERHPERVLKRRDWVLSRLEEEGWADAKATAAARKRGVGLKLHPPKTPIGRHFLSWVSALAEDKASRRLAKGRGVVVETTLDPILQSAAEEAVAKRLAALRRGYRSLRDAPLSAALVALDPDTGAVLAYVGGDPAAQPAGFDRARSARRQPGSAVKPLLLFEAFETCGRREPLYPSARVADAPLRLEMPSGTWEPVNSDGTFRGVLSVRAALRESRNVPFVRVARWCGLKPTGDRVRRAGLGVPDDPPPAFALGAIETSPLELARAYTAIAAAGRSVKPRPVRRLERPGGRKLHRFKTGSRQVANAETAYLIHDLLLDAARDGTARAAAVDGLEVAAKTGTTSERRDAWLAGYAGGVVAVVWVGRDDAKPLGLTGTGAAAPLWKAFMERAVRARPPRVVARPEGVVSVLGRRRNGPAGPAVQPERPVRDFPSRCRAATGSFLAR